MTDPAEQLRRLADARADSVGPFVPPPRGHKDEDEDGGAEVIVLRVARRVAVVAAAVVAIGAVGIGTFLLVVERDGRSHESAEVAEVPSSADPAEVDAVNSSAPSGPTTTAPSETIVPDVVGQDVDSAFSQLQENGFEPFTSALLVPRDDGRVGTVVAQDPPSNLSTASTRGINIVVVRLDAATVGHDSCSRPAYDLGDLDGDGVDDRIFPRWEDGRISEIEVCTATRVSAVATGLDLHAIELVDDLDLDGRDEIIAVADEAGADARILTLVGDTLAEVPGALEFGPRLDGSNAWWGCVAFSREGDEQLGSGTWRVRDDGTIEWEIVDISIEAGEFVANRAAGSTNGDGPAGLVGRPRCVETDDGDPPPACDVDQEVAMIGDVDGDGELDTIAPREGVVCLGNQTVTEIGRPADDVGVWFLDDMNDDGIYEVFLGTTTRGSITVRPWSVDAAGSFTAVAVEGCCEQSAVDAALNDAGQARWFSCIDGVGESSGELMSGRYWVQVEPGVVRWTIDIGSGADPEREYAMLFDDPTATDAWIPGNGCRGAGTPAVTIEFGDDHAATVDSLAAFNQLLASDDDVDRRFVRLREALGIADEFREASGPYREDIGESFIELAGLHDDSVAATRWDFAFSEDGAELISVARSWSCHPDRGHHDFSTELCA